MGKQYVARKSLTRGGNQAIRLNAQRTLSPALIASTVKLVVEKAAAGPVQLRRATAAFQRGQLIIQAGEAFYFVASKFERRFYVVAIRNGNFVCSINDERIAERCIDQVVGFVADEAA